MPTGKFSVVSVPIGNIDDITKRGIDTLRSADFIVAEDTRQIGKLLKLLEIEKKELISYRDQNHDRVFPKILNYIEVGKNIALVSDRGTPTISDPGFKLVRDLQKEGIQAVTIPGVSAVISALSISGLPTDSFTFLGFLPKKEGKFKKTLEQFNEIDTTIIFFESPHRLEKATKYIEEIFPECEVALVKELTKLNENVFKGSVSDIRELLTKISHKGEWVILVRN